MIIVTLVLKWIFHHPVNCNENAAVILYHLVTVFFLNIPHKLKKTESLCKTKIILSYFTHLTLSSQSVCYPWRIQGHNFLMHYLHLSANRFCGTPAQWNQEAAQYSSFPYVEHKVGYWSVSCPVEILNRHEFQLI